MRNKKTLVLERSTKPDDIHLSYYDAVDKRHSVLAIGQGPWR
jgi:hypothetical protein